MKAMEHFPEKNPNPVLSVEKDCTVLYSNKAAKPLLIEWGVEVGDKLPSYIGDLVQRVISRNGPEKIEVKVGKSVYLVTFQPFPEEECVNIYGFDISDLTVLEEKLRESEEKYRIVADNTFDWEFWLDPNGCFLYTSPSCERVTGYASKEFMDNPDLLLEIIHSDDRQAFLQHKHDMQLSRHGDIEFRIITKDGEIRWIHHLCQPIYDSKGCYAGNRGSNRDITEHRQAEHQLNNELARATGLYELYTRSLTLSDRELYDFALNQAVKITDSTIGFFHLVSEDEKEVILTTWNQEALRSCTAANEGHYPIEKAGNWVDCVRLKRPVIYNDFPSSPNQKGLPAGHATVKRFMSVPVTENGKVRIIFGVGNKVDEYDDRDVVQIQLVANELHKIMKLRRIENEVRESEAFLQNIMKNVSDAIFVNDREARMILANPAFYRLMGKSPEEVLNKTVADYHPSEIAKKLTEDNKRVMETGKVTTFEERIFTSHGWRIFQTVKAPYYNGQGNIIGLIGAARDITERKQEEHRIRRYNCILKGINWIFNNVIQAKTEEELGEACLSVALKVTGSEFGYIIEVGADGLLHDVAKSKLAWEQCNMYDKTGHLCLPHDYAVHGLYGSVIINGKSFFTNDPQSHPDSAGLLVGHPPIKSFLTVPLILDGKTVGSIGVGNREGGYSYEQQEDLEAIAPAVTQAMQRKKAEEKIQTLANVVESSNDAIITKSLDGIITSWNNGAERIYGYLAEEVLGESISILEPDNTKGETKYLIGQIKKGEKVQHYETLRTKKDGTIINVSVTLSPVFDASVELVAISAIARDITERKKSEEALKKAHENLEIKVKERTSELEEANKSLKKSEKGLAEAQKMAHIGNWEWDIAADKAYWSEEMYRIFGRSPQELAPTYNEFLNYIHPDDRHHVACAANKALNEKSSFSIDFRITSDDEEERTIHMLSETICDEKNCPVRIKGIVQDITERKKAEEKIKILANAVESSLDAIGTISLDGNITSWNKGAEQVYGYSAEEILGKHVSILAPSHLANETIKLIEVIKQGESIHQYETSWLGKDEKKIYVSITLSPIFDTNGKLSAVSFVSRDMTERKKAEEALRSFEIARKKELHHRIKNNLQVISSLLDLQADLFKGRKTIADSEVLEAFKESIDRVLSIALIHEELYKGKNIDLLNFSQYIKELANNLLLTYSLKTDVSLNFDLEENIFLDMDTAIPLGIIINEIVSNSFKYAFSGRDKGEIRVKFHKEEKGDCKIEDCKSIFYVLSVSDDGIGIPENLNIESLDSLGLQLITSLVDQIDGKFELKRNNGTQFTISFTVSEKDK